MGFLLIFALLLAVAVVPVMVGARLVKAEKTGFGTALFAVVLLAALSAALEHFVPNQALAFVIAMTGGAAILAGVLGTTFLRGLAVSVIAIGLQLLVLLVVAGALVPEAVAADGVECDFDQAGVREQLRTRAARVPGATLSGDGTLATWEAPDGRRVALAYGGCVDLGTSVTVTFPTDTGVALAVREVVDATAKYASTDRATHIATVLAERRAIETGASDGGLRFDAPPDAEGLFPFGFSLDVTPREAVISWQEL